MGTLKSRGYMALYNRPAGQYGRKIEMAISLRKKGCRLLVVSEDDFYDATLENE